MDNRFIELLTRQLSDTLTAEEQQELNLLLKNNKAYREQKEILTDYWKSDNLEYKANAAVFKKVMDKIQAEGLPLIDEEEVSLEPRKRSMAVWYSAAAAILMLCTTAYYFYYTRITKPGRVEVASVWHQKNTKPREKMAITLADGTVVTLNSATKFKYPESFTGKTREVYLDGEAFFDVHKDHQHPFIIHTNKMNVRVLGTAFNVKSYTEEKQSETTLIRGSIEVTLNDRPSDRIILKPKEKLIVQNNTFSKTTNIATDAPAAQSAPKGTQYALTNLTYIPNNAKTDSTVVETSWIRNKLVFRDEDFESIAMQMERWYGVQIVFKKEGLKNLRFTATFEKETAMQALVALSGTEDFRYRIKNEVIYIY